MVVATGLKGEGGRVGRRGRSRGSGRGRLACASAGACVVHAADGTSPLDFLPYRDGKPLPGGFKLGMNPGLVKHEGTQSILWGEEVRERFNAPELNLTRYIKDGQVTDKDSGE